MYAKSIVEKRIELAEKRLGFRLERHSVSEVDDFDTRLKQKYQDQYMAARSSCLAASAPTQERIFQATLTKLLNNPASPRLTSDEVRWMQNERALVMCDTEYFLTRYYWIRDTANDLIHFSFDPRPAQRILFNCFGELEERGVAIEILLAKARQLGQSTLVIGCELPKVQWSHGVNAVSASADSAKTREMVSKLLMAYDLLPWWIRTPYKTRSESDQGFIRFGQQWGISFQHGEQINPIAMGSTVVCYHVSEVSSFPNPAQTIDVGLFKAVHPSPRVLGVLESTCKGNTGWWHDSYWDAKKLWKEGAYRLMALFLPFYTAIGMYPNPTEEIAHPIPQDWHPMPETHRMIRESEEYVRSNDVLARVMMQDGREWKMPRKQAWYWEWNYRSHRDRGEERNWLAEMPHTDKAAFQSSYDSVFGKEVIAQIDARRESKYDVYMLRGQSIEERHEPADEDFDETEKIIPISWASRRGITYRWEAVPVMWAEPFEQLEDLRKDFSHHGKLFVYEHPQPGYDYAVGVRTSSGISSSPSVVAVCRRSRNPQEQDVQVAEWRDIEVSHVEVYAWAAAITAYYGKYMTDFYRELHPELAVRYRHPYVSIEQVKSVGDTCQLQMQKMGFSRFHKMKRYDKKLADIKNANGKLGFYSFAYMTPILNDGFVTYATYGWYKVNSPYTINEMDHWEIHTIGENGRVDFQPPDEQSSAGLAANALAAFCPNDLNPLTDRTMKSFITVGEKRPRTIDVEPTEGGTVFPLTPEPQKHLTRSESVLT